MFGLGRRTISNNERDDPEEMESLRSICVDVRVSFEVLAIAMFDTQSDNEFSSESDFRISSSSKSVNI